MKRWRIKTRRDWVIAAGFLFLLSYLIAVKYRQHVNEWLMRFSPEKMSYFNQPENQGAYLLAVLLAAIFLSILWICQRRTDKKRFGKGLALIWAAAAVLSGIIWFSYQSECRQIVNTPYEGLKANVSISGWDGEPAESPELTAEEQEELLNLCLGLEVPSEEEQEALRARTDEEGQISIEIWYPQYKNHSYHLWFFLEEDVISLNRGHNADESVYYDGTKVRALVDEILASHG